MAERSESRRFPMDWREPLPRIDSMDDLPSSVPLVWQSVPNAASYHVELGTAVKLDVPVFNSDYRVAKPACAAMATL